VAWVPAQHSGIALLFTLFMSILSFAGAQDDGGRASLGVGPSVAGSPTGKRRHDDAPSSSSNKVQRSKEELSPAHVKVAQFV
jgi:hypothetical protein